MRDEHHAHHLLPLFIVQPPHPCPNTLHCIFLINVGLPKKLWFPIQYIKSDIIILKSPLISCKPRLSNCHNLVISLIVSIRHHHLEPPGVQLRTRDTIIFCTPKMDCLRHVLCLILLVASPVALPDNTYLRLISFWYWYWSQV